MLKKLGDGLMALFGYPQAEENDAERAVRAALAIHRSLGELNARNARSGEPELAVRIGIDTGPVVVEPEVKCTATRLTWPRGCRRWPSRDRSWSRLDVQRQIAGLFVVEDRARMS